MARDKKIPVRVRDRLQQNTEDLLQKDTKNTAVAEAMVECSGNRTTTLVQCKRQNCVNLEEPRSGVNWLVTRVTSAHNPRNSPGKGARYGDQSYSLLSPSGHLTERVHEWRARAFPSGRCGVV
jgi:hypothetical protein